MLFSRISSGLDFLDASIGGLYSNRCYLVRGPSQSGRTTATLQFLTAGIENGENGLMISSDRIENVILKAEAMGISLENYLTDNKLILMEYPKEIMSNNYNYKTIISLLGEIEQFVNHYNISRLVFDTLHPLLTKTSEPHLVNYIYSLMNSLEALKVTSIVTAGEPNSQSALRMIQLIEDATVGSFSLSVTGSDQQKRRGFSVNKMVDRINPPMDFKVKLDYGVGLVQDFTNNKSTDEKRLAKVKELSLTDLPLNIGILDGDIDTETQIEEIFHKDSTISVFEEENELKMQMSNIDCDLMLLNVNWTNGHVNKIIRRLRDFYPKLPIFLFATQKRAGLTYKTANQVDANGLFIKPFVPKELLGAFTKTLKNYGIYDDVLEKRSQILNPKDLPEDIASDLLSLDSDDEASEIELLTLPVFKEMIHKQIWKCKQSENMFSLVSFKMSYISEISQIPHLPKGLELVKRVSRVVVDSLRGLDDKACRYMDKVLVLLEDTDEKGARAFSSRVVNELKSELSQKLDIQVGKHLQILNAVAVYPESGDNINDLLLQVTDASRNFVKLQSK